MTADPLRSVPDRRTCLAGMAALFAGMSLRTPRAAPADPAALDRVVADAGRLGNLNSLIISQGGDTLVEQRFRGPGLDRGVNVKSISKTWIATLTGIAIDRGALDGVDQPIAPLLADRLPSDPDPRLAEVTIGHLLAMRAGLERTSGPFYGRWVTSPDWVRYALSRPFVDEPGGAMLYSTGNSHLLSAILTEVAGRSTRASMRAWLGDPLDIAIPDWPRDPQGIYFGGNDMVLSPRALVRFGDMIRQGGVLDGRRIVPADWIERSWRPRTRSPYTGHAYGYGWFLAEARGYPVRYAWGYGGQMLYVVPGLALTVAMTSDPTTPSGRTGYARQLHDLLANGIIPAIAGGGTGPTAGDTPPSGAEPSGG
ncbi:serine hydrolase domain-containing protein [Marinivivus vitaminiproducens]|uniref:serine hydrolase domain-containing protein n=1 Tax=Marinivivus vitaminiproducens TaxID=3035935 RepID=UPI0027A296F7|nr:serine hydrolase [Geminicoccaceae bacterium SCSIO 64248]